MRGYMESVVPRGHVITTAVETDLLAVLGALTPPARSVLGIVINGGDASVTLFYDEATDEAIFFHDMAAAGRPNNQYLPWPLALRNSDGNALKILTTGATVDVTVLYDAGS